MICRGFSILEFSEIRIGNPEFIIEVLSETKGFDLLIHFEDSLSIKKKSGFDFKKSAPVNTLIVSGICES